MSEGLETLKNIFSHWNCCNPNSNGCYEEDFEIIEKELKALEIIKKKRVDVDFLFEEWEEENYEFALENYNFNHIIELTQEEFDLLKEVLL